MPYSDHSAPVVAKIASFMVSTFALRLHPTIIYKTARHVMSWLVRGTIRLSMSYAHPTHYYISLRPENTSSDSIAENSPPNDRSKDGDFA